MTTQGPSALRADFCAAPIGLDEPPLLSWVPVERGGGSEIRIEVDGEPPKRVRLRSTVPRWQMRGPLLPHATYTWRVRSLPDGAWSGTARFETGPVREPDWLGARWIGAPERGPAPILSARFERSRAGPARLHLSGLGVADVRIDGRRVSDAVLDPPPTAYGSVVPYRSLDVSEFVGAGGHELTVRLGRGFYAMTTPTAFGWHAAPWRREPRLRLLLVDPSRPAVPLLRSEPGWSVESSEVLEDSFYTGMVVDLGAASTTTDAVEVEAPGGTLRSVRQPPVTRRERVAAVDHRWTGPSRQRFEVERTVAAIVTVTPPAPTEALLVKLGEHLDDDGRVLAEDGAVHGELQRSTLLHVPAHRAVELDLTYAGLRYAEVSGSPDRVELRVDRVSAAPEVVGAFRSNVPLLDRIHAITRSTVENCLQGTPIDTPVYEKQAYTGDTQLLAETYAYNHWMPRTLGAWLAHSLLPMQHDDGSFPGIAPSPPGDWIFDTPSPAWDAALFEVPSTLLRHYGDLSSLRRALPAQRRYLEHLAARFPDGIVDRGLGDWNPPGHVMPPESPAIVSSAYHHRFLVLYASFAARLGEHREAERASRRATDVRAAFDRRFWQDAGWYEGPGGLGYRETDNLLAVAFGLVPDSRRPTVLATIERELRGRGSHLDTGMVGTKQLLRVLAGSGRQRLAFDVATADGYPGWGHWISAGATTLYENWELDGRSHDHAMFGTIDEWLYADVGGLSPGAEAWDAVHVAPRMPGDGRFECGVELETMAGRLTAEWQDRGPVVVGRVTAPGHVPVIVPEGSGLVVESDRVQRIGPTVEHVLALRSRS